MRALPLWPALILTASAIVYAAPAHGVQPPQNSPAQEPSPDDQAEKSKIMQSERWRKAQFAFDEWLSVQNMYNAEEIKNLKADQQKEIEQMSAGELQEFLDLMEKKMEILNSKEAKTARAYVARYLSVLAPHYRNEFKQQLPKVAEMTPAQVEQHLQEFQLKIKSRRQLAQRERRLIDLQVSVTMRANDRRHKEAFVRALQRNRALTSQPVFPAGTNIQRPLRFYRSPYLFGGAWRFSGLRFGGFFW